MPHSRCNEKVRNEEDKNITLVKKGLEAWPMWVFFVAVIGTRLPVRAGAYPVIKRGVWDL